MVTLDPGLTRLAFLKSLNDEVYLRDIIKQVIMINRSLTGDFNMIVNSKAQIGMYGIYCGIIIYCNYYIPF